VRTEDCGQIAGLHLHRVTFAPAIRRLPCGHRECKACGQWLLEQDMSHLMHLQSESTDSLCYTVARTDGERNRLSDRAGHSSGGFMSIALGGITVVISSNDLGGRLPPLRSRRVSLETAISLVRTHLESRTVKKITWSHSWRKPEPAQREFQIGTAGVNDEQILHEVVAEACSEFQEWGVTEERGFPPGASPDVRQAFADSVARMFEERLGGV